MSAAAVVALQQRCNSAAVACHPVSAERREKKRKAGGVVFLGEWCLGVLVLLVLGVMVVVVVSPCTWCRAH